MIKPGDRAPAFSARDDAGHTVSLAAFGGKYVVLYFYPKDDTSGCTREACSFRDAIASLSDAGAVVIGVSPDTEGSHAKFKEKYSLPLTLLADEDHAVADAYGVWAEKSFMGKTYWGVNRTTFLINPEGRIAHVWEKVKPEGRAGEVLEALRQIAGARTT
jgi:peroxiredoxin Q/BCP